MSAVRKTLALPGGRLISLEAQRDGDRLVVHYDGRSREIRIVPRGEGQCDLLFDDGTLRRVRYSRATSEGRWASAGAVTWGGRVVRAGRGGAGPDSGGLVSPMPGRVVSLEVAEGDRVEAGQIVVRVEAMKMEHAIKAPYAGVVAAIHFQEGATVDGGAALLEVTADPPSAEEEA